MSTWGEMLRQSSSVIVLVLVTLSAIHVGCTVGVPHSVCPPGRIYLNLFKVLLTDNSHIRSVEQLLSQNGFVYKGQIVSRFHLFSLKEDIGRSTCPLDQDWTREIHHEAIISIIQDFETLKQKSVSARRPKRLLHHHMRVARTKTRTHHPRPRKPRSTNRRVTNRKVTVGVLDNGFQMDHPNLVHAINRTISYDFLHNDFDPWHTPGFNPDEYYPNKDTFITVSHGTLCMGIIASKGLAGTECCDGASDDIQLVGIQISDYDSAASDTAEARAVMYLLPYIDIVSASYGIPENAGFLDVRDATKEALRLGAEQGRDCKGRIYVYPSGNGIHDNCNMDGYAKSVHTLTITDVNENLQLPGRVERCPCKLAAAIVNDKVKMPGIYNTCIDGYKGSSFAVPVGAGYIAEVLQVNPDLTKRDVEHIIINSSTQADFDSNIKWKTNAAGFKYNDTIGFGLINLAGMSTLARHWHGVPEVIQCQLTTDGNRFNITYPNCDIRYLEHVEVEIDMCCQSCFDDEFGALAIAIQSPMKTTSSILTTTKLRRRSNTLAKRCVTWMFMSYEFWGELPLGTWNVMWTADHYVKFTVNARRVILYGTDEDPMMSRRRKSVSCPDRKFENGEQADVGLNILDIVIIIVDIAGFFAIPWLFYVGIYKNILNIKKRIEFNGGISYSVVYHRCQNVGFSQGEIKETST